MKSLEKLLLVIACAVTSSAPATEQPRSAGAVWPAIIITDAQAANVAHPGRDAPVGAGIMESPLGVDRLIDRAASRLKIAFDWGGGSARATVKTGAGARESIPAAAAAVPESPEWMQLLCGLAFVAFMAQRRARPPAD